MRVKKGIRARRSLRRWRLGQVPRVTQDECGEFIGKSGELIRLFETGKADLQDEDSVKLHRRTGIPLAEFLTRDDVRRITEAATMLDGGEAA